MNAIDLTPLYRSSIGFDRLAKLLDSSFSVDANASTYPPYNIESLDENRYAITLAVAGFKEEDIEIVVEKGVLSVKGKKEADDKRQYLHQGIANRAFERKFNLADFVEVTGADLVNGLLTIALVKEVPDEMKPKKISISSDNRVLEHRRSDASGDDKAA